jgi:hypothetical protein
MIGRFINNLMQRSASARVTNGLGRKGSSIGQGDSLVAAGVKVLFGLEGTSMTVERAGSIGQTGCSPPPFRDPRRPCPWPPSIVPGQPYPRALRARSWGGRTDSHYRTSRLDIALRLTSG